MGLRASGLRGRASNLRALVSPFLRLRQRLGCAEPGHKRITNATNRTCRWSPILSKFIGPTPARSGGNLNRISVEGPNAVIGGTDGWSPGGSCTGDCNLISASGTGISVPGGGLGATIYGNMLGTDITGTQPLPNQTGILAQASNPLIGGPGTGEGNLISSGGRGITVTINGTPTIQGNFIGTDTSGTSLIDPKDFSTGIYITWPERSHRRRL